jgi:predicted aldo/keto reductase-like oxidoreductase
LAENPKIRENIILCDKLPMHEELYNKFGYDGDNIEEVFDKLFEKQLECLNTDYLDIYMIHALDDNKFMTEEKYIAAIKWMQKKKFEGKIKHIGFSAHIDLYKLNYYIDLFEKNFGKGIVDTAMLTYNIFSGSDWVTEQTGINVWTNPGKKGIELCKGHGITVISMMPLESGRALEVSHDKTFTDWCYKFIFDNKFITSTLSGTSNIKHLQQMIDVYNANHNILKKPEEKTVSKKFSKKVIKKESK